MATSATSFIEKTPGVCGGDARVRNTRIPVWLLVVARKWGRTEEELLADYPTLTAADLDAVWDYYRENPLGVEQTIWKADIAANVPDGCPPPAWVLVAGLLVGLLAEEVRNQFDPPVSGEALEAAWQEYRADPALIGWQLANYRRAR
jgi:uncharacterized protein (DUF433 family)